MRNNIDIELKNIAIRLCYFIEHDKDSKKHQLELARELKTLILEKYPVISSDIDRVIKMACPEHFDENGKLK